MKNIIIITILLALISSCALEQASPSDYNDAIFREQIKIKESLSLLAKTTDIERQAEIVNELKEQSSKSLERIKEIGAFRGDEQLYLAAVQLFEFYDKMIREGLDTAPNKISSSLDQWRKMMSDEEHLFFKAQGKFAENYELFL